MCVWRENMGDDQAPLVKHLIGLDKIISSLLLVVGLVYFVKVTCCFLNWGQNVEENWKILIDQYYKDSEVQLRQASSLSDIKTTPQKIRRVPQLGSLLTPPPSGATTPQVNVQPATPGSMTPRYSPSRIPTTRALRRLETPESPSGYSPSEQEEPLENEQSCASDTTTPLSPLLMAGGLLLELDKTLNNSATKAASLNNRQFADPLSRSSSVDRHPFNFSPEDFGSSNGEEPESQHRVRRTHTNRLTSLPSPSSANGASLTPTRSY
ncbi:hypothetical protein CPB83DRAFT_261447 [Crepidotus variabilis]|uniref:Uncharacterized protein n=1 Tax=Crepidotus variabilis TaxID=179855 RepID=A0A9P6EJ69_9AGAR|nr:hypothetical protein CPB83DRAFT_261447 [Crepidotus variabilis]